MIFYKIKHIPTELFYKSQPTQAIGMRKSNLTLNGKAYQKYPSQTLTYIFKHGYYHPYENLNRLTKAVEGDFQIIEYSVKE